MLLVAPNSLQRTKQGPFIPVSPLCRVFFTALCFSAARDTPVGTFGPS